MECRAIIDSLSDYLDGYGNQSSGMPDSEVNRIEEHLDACPGCQTLKLELTELKIAARELPLHTPPQAVWLKIANVLETELPASERKTREDFPTQTWWNRLKERHFRLNFPQIIGAGALAMVLLVVGIFGIPGSHTKTGELNLADMQSALLPDENQIKADLNSRLVEINQHKSKWEPQVRTVFEQRLTKIEESLDTCRQGLRGNPNDQTQQQVLRGLYNEKRQLLDEAEPQKR
ncbi:MAG: hypothetical protein ABIP14_16335 [Blastocatellia bacterium]